MGGENIVMRTILLGRSIAASLSLGWSVLLGGSTLGSTITSTNSPCGWTPVLGHWLISRLCRRPTIL